DCLPCGHDVCC
uniref:Augerpeptide hheTx1 n=1 Tax=Hastula hectica TaxID=745793 RepID=TEG1_HASHE|nr:RecName: Full=Augerpeptide hheTx1 [Hastula hectica]